MSDEDEKLYLRARVSMLEDAVAELLAREDVPADMIAAWRRWTHHDNGFSHYLHATMNNIVARMGRRSWPRKPIELIPPKGRKPSYVEVLPSMCGRARLSTDFSQVRIKMSLSPDAPSLNLRPDYNIAPTKGMLIVANRPDVGRAARLAHWGLIPSWAKEPKAMGATFNARAESFREKPTFRNAWSKGRRCLVVVDSFYEWQKDDKWPVAIARRDGGLMAFGGLWERWHREGQEEIFSTTIITQEAGEAMRLIHDREPLILDEKDWPVWLGERPGDVDALIKPVPLDTLVYWRVSKAVGNVKNNGPELIEQLGR